MRALFVLGRAMFGGFFVWSGLNHIAEPERMSQHVNVEDAAAAEAAIRASGALLLAGGLSIVLGLKPRVGLAAIVAFLLPVSLQVHRFWDTQDPQDASGELIHFSKNMALVGAALMMMQPEEPWPLSLDAALAADEDMYVHLGGRELRALPA
jgi:uncharacterized membrane protein YphA (DoxX/SURF4 family)